MSIRIDSLSADVVALPRALQREEVIKGSSPRRLPSSPIVNFPESYISSSSIVTNVYSEESTAPAGL